MKERTLGVERKGGAKKGERADLLAGDRQIAGRGAGCGTQSAEGRNPSAREE